MNPNAPSIWSKSWRILPWEKLQPGEASLAWGLAFLAVTVAFTHFVMVWMLAVFTLPLAVLLLVMGVVKSRDSAASSGQKAKRFGLLFLGIAALWLVAYLAVALSYKLAIHVQAPEFAVKNYGPLPGFLAWALHLGSWLIPAWLMSAGLSFWTNWPPRRRRVWLGIILLVPMASFLLHRFLAHLGGPLTA